MGLAVAGGKRMCDYCENNKKIKHFNIISVFSKAKIPMNIWIEKNKMYVGAYGCDKSYDKNKNKDYIWCKKINYCPMCGRDLRGGK